MAPLFDKTSRFLDSAGQKIRKKNIGGAGHIKLPRTPPLWPPDASSDL